MKNYYRYIILAFIIIFTWNAVSAQQTKPRKRGHKQETVSECPLIDSIIAFSKTKLGARYASGGTGPNSFDCSGFMYYVFGHFNIKLGRSSRDQILMGRKIERDEIQPGDLVFWYRGKGYVGHAGMVVSVDSAHNFTFIHAATYGKGVRYDNSTSNWYSSTYAGARRIIECDGDGHAVMIQPDGKSSVLANTTPKPETDTVAKTSDNMVPTPTTATPTSTPSKMVEKITYHKIKNGETLSTIARKYHVSVSQLKKWNHLRSDMIHAGSKLKIVRKVATPKIETAANEVVGGATTPASADKTSETPKTETVSTDKDPAPATVDKLASTQTQTIYHRINSGETLSMIARKYQVTVEQIKQWNHLESDMIRAGESLKIETKATAEANKNTPTTATPTFQQNASSQPAPAQPKPIYHKIKKGETLSTIAQKYHVSVKQLKQWNHLKSDMIREGEKLKIIRK